MPDRILTDEELEPSRKASRNYREVCKLYRDGSIDDSEYFKGRRVYEEAMKDFDRLHGN